MKILLILLLVVVSLFSKTVTIQTTGTYTQLSFAKDSPIPDETRYARKQALLFAKERAIEEAGTTLYVSFTSIKEKNKKDKVKNSIEAIASALIKTKILKEGWSGNKYIVKIEAIVDSKDAEKVFNKADKRLRAISILQKENKKMLEEIHKISDKIFSIGRNSHTLTSELELHKISSKQKKYYFTQVKLLDKLEENLLSAEVHFKKGTLLDLALQEEARSNKSLKKAKLYFDEFFSKKFKNDLIVRILDIKVKKHGEKADVEFLLFYGNKNYKNMTRKLSKWFYMETNDWYSRSYKGEAKGYLFFNRADDTARLRKWIIENRNFAIRIKIGNRYYYTKNIAEYREIVTDYSNGIKTHRDVFAYYRNKNGVQTKRIVKNISLKELSNIYSIKAELVYNNKKNNIKYLPIIK